TTERVSVGPGRVQGNGHSYESALSADGLEAAFASSATNFCTGDVNERLDVFVRTRNPVRAIATCFGDGSDGHCPCSNLGTGKRGCENSAGTGGASLIAWGETNPDTVVLQSSHEPPVAVGIFLQGTVAFSPGVAFGDGLRCVAGWIRRLYVKAAVDGV